MPSERLVNEATTEMVTTEPDMNTVNGRDAPNRDNVVNGRVATKGDEAVNRREATKGDEAVDKKEATKGDEAVNGREATQGDEAVNGGHANKENTAANGAVTTHTDNGSDVNAAMDNSGGNGDETANGARSGPVTARLPGQSPNVKTRPKRADSWNEGKKADTEDQPSTPSANLDSEPVLPPLDLRIGRDWLPSLSTLDIIPRTVEGSGEGLEGRVTSSGRFVVTRVPSPVASLCGGIDVSRGEDGESSAASILRRRDGLGSPEKRNVRFPEKEADLTEEHSASPTPSPSPSPSPEVPPVAGEDEEAAPEVHVVEVHAPPPSTSSAAPNPDLESAEETDST